MRGRRGRGRGRGVMRICTGLEGANEIARVFFFFASLEEGRGGG